MSKIMAVIQIGSPIRRPVKQRQTLIGLGLNKMHKISVIEDTPSTRGMVRKIPHLAKVIGEGDSETGLTEIVAGYEKAVRAQIPG